MTLEQSQKIYNLTNKLTHSFGLKFEMKFSLSSFFFYKGLDLLFDYILKRKQGLLDYKNDIREKFNNWYFSKELSHGFD